jgi:hypothetical protein
VRKIIRNLCRNRAIDKRIEKLEPHTIFPGHWSAMSEEERAQMVRTIAAVRHAIARMKKLKR